MRSYQDYLGLTPIEAMLRLLPMSPAGIAVNIVFMLIASRVTGQIIIILGCIGTGLANLLFAVIKTDVIFWAFGFPAAVLSVWGSDLYVIHFLWQSTMSNSATASCPAEACSPHMWPSLTSRA